MNSTIAIPIWLFVLLSIIALWSILERIFLPGARWFLRRQVNYAIDEINTRLRITIRPFQLTKKQVLVDRLVYDKDIIDTLQKHAEENDMPREVVQEEIERYAREIVPQFNAYVYFRYSYWIAKKISQQLYRVRVGFVRNNRLADVDPEATVVFVINHRSNMDYVLVSYLASEQTTLSYAVGEWAKIWPLQTLIQYMGAFFVRRNSRNPLYRKVLARYVDMATREGVCQAVFPEGGLTRDGKLLTARLGVLDYMLRGYNPENCRDIVFIPIGINYDRTLEDRTQLRSLDPNVKKRSAWFVIKTTARFIFKTWGLSTRDRWHRFGYAGVNFGQPISTREYCREHGVVFCKLERQERFGEVNKLAQKLMAAIADVVPILPVSLITTVLIREPDKQHSPQEIASSVNELISFLQERGAPIRDVERPHKSTLVNSLAMLCKRGLIHYTNDGCYQVNPEERTLLCYYANSIEHWLH